jgi:hypothetical protein
MVGIGIGIGRKRKSWSRYWASRTPSNLNSEQVSETEIDIIWDDAIKPSDGLKVYLSTDNGLNYTYNKTIPYGQESTRITGLTASTVYIIKLVAYKGINESTPVTTIIATINTALIDGWNFVSEDVSYFNHAVADYGAVSLGYNNAQYFNGNTYVVYCGNSNDPYIIKYNHATKLWSNPVKVATNPMPDLDQGHGEPSLLIDKLGYIHVVFGSHQYSGSINNAGKYCRSTNTEDISSWDVMSDFPDGTYQHFVEFSTGKIFMFYRSVTTPDCYWSYITSDDNGSSWSAATVISHDFAYCTYHKGHGDVIHCAMCGNNTTLLSRYNVYYAKYDGANWKDVADNNLTLPLTLAGNGNALIVRDGETDWIPVASCSADSNEDPIIYYSESRTENTSSTYDHKIAKYSEGTWNNVLLGVSSDAWHDYFVALNLISDTNYEAFLIHGGTVGIGGNIEKWSSFDSGNTWSKIKTIREGRFFAPIMVRNYHDDIKIIFQNIIAQTYIYGDAIYGWGENGFVKGKTVNLTDIGSIRETHPFLLSGASIVSGGLSFSGSGQNILTIDQDDISFNGGSPDKPFTVTAILTIKGTNAQYIWFKSGNGTQVEWRIYYASSALHFRISDLTATKYKNIDATFTPSSNEVALAVSYDGSGLVTGMKIYINGVNATTSNSSGGTYAGMANGTAGLTFGSDLIPANYFEGTIKNMRIWDKVLSDAEIALAQNEDLRW